jgi:hypothetical protein
MLMRDFVRFIHKGVVQLLLDLLDGSNRKSDMVHCISIPGEFCDNCWMWCLVAGTKG